MKTNIVQGNFKMGDIDEVSSLLGELKSGIGNLAHGHEMITNKLIIIDDKLSSHTASRILDRAAIDSLHKRMDIIEPIVDGHADKFKFIAWVVAGVTSIVTLVINWLAPFWGKVIP
jgi:hypothetical protein